MKYTPNERLSRNVQEAEANEILEERNERFRRIKKLYAKIASNYRVIFFLVFILACLILNFDVRNGPGFPFKLVGISIFKYGILAYPNILLASLTLCVSLINHILIEKQVLMNAIQSTIERIVTYGRDLNERAQEEARIMSSLSNYILEKLHIMVAPTMGRGLDRSSTYLYNKTVFYLMKIEVFLLWVSLFWLSASLVSFTAISTMDPALVTQNFAFFSGVSTDYLYNLAIRLIPFLGVLWARISLRKRDSKYFTPVKYFLFLLGYGALVGGYNVLVYLITNVWLYKICELFSLSFFLTHGFILSLSSFILYQLIKIINSITEDGIYNTYKNFMEYGFDGSHDNTENRSRLYYISLCIFWGLGIGLLTFSVYAGVMKATIFFIKLAGIPLYSSITIPMDPVVPVPPQEGILDTISQVEGGIWARYQEFLSSISRHISSLFSNRVTI